MLPLPANLILCLHFPTATSFFTLQSFNWGFSETQSQITNLPTLPNALPTLPKNPLNVLKFKIPNFISFWKTLS